MGNVLISYYAQAEEKGGLSAQLKLAMITKIPSSKAETLPDSSENIKIFEDAIKQIKENEEQSK